MSNVIAIRNEDVGARVLLPFSEMPEDQKVLLREACNSVKLNDMQLALLVDVARRSGLDPMRRHIYGLIFDGKFTLLTGIDGFRAVAARNGLAGADEIRFTYDEEKDPGHTYPITATSTVYRRDPRSGEKDAYTATVHMREYRRFKAGGELQKNWKEKPHTMLGKCARAQSYREGFTESLGGIYERAEFGEADGEAASRTMGAARRGADILQQPPRAQRPAGAEPIDAEWHEGGDAPPPEDEGA
jgi:phage recombination protein Bet